MPPKRIGKYVGEVFKERFGDAAKYQRIAGMSFHDDILLLATLHRDPVHIPVVGKGML